MMEQTTITHNSPMPSIDEFEVMAPVGSRESLAAAIQAGADSIYFGIEKLNMRAHSASVFAISDLREIAATCREHGIKSYLTVNTIIYGEDIPLMHDIIDAAKDAGISAVIASDVAVMTYCNRVGQEVHLSTQLNISNIEALRFYAQFADVVVLAYASRCSATAHCAWPSLASAISRFRTPDARPTAASACKYAAAHTW